MARFCSFLAVAMVLICCAHAQTESTTNVMTTYFGSHSFLCNNDEVNLTYSRPLTMYWMLPSGKLVSEDSQLEKNTLSITTWLGLAYNLTITRITDDDFGYYTCILRYRDDVKVVRWGLNLNGPDYSDLRENYRMSAITGAIAASVLLGVVALGCIIWHFKFSKRSGKEAEEPGSQYIYDNSAAVPLEDMEVKNQPTTSSNDVGEAANGHSSGTIDIKL